MRAVSSILFAGFEPCLIPSLLKIMKESNIMY